MKVIGLVIAVIEEVEALLEASYKVKKIEEFPYEIYEAQIGNNKLYICHSGCGEIYAASATQYLITKFNCELILNYGICGAISPALNKLDTCIVKEIINYDFDTDPIDHKGVGYYTNLKTSILTPSKELIKKAKSIVDLPLYRVCSGNRFIDKEEEKEYLHKTFNAEICEMESAAIYLVAKQNNVDTLFIKGVSDSYHDNGLTYSEMAKISAKHACEIFIKIIKDL